MAKKCLILEGVVEYDNLYGDDRDLMVDNHKIIELFKDLIGKKVKVIIEEEI